MTEPMDERDPRSPRLLIADDDDTVREAVREVLSVSGFDIVGEAASGEAAVAAALDLRPDAVLMDLRMPGIDGLEATSRIREAVPEVPVVVMSAHEDEGSIERARRAGATRYVVKGTGAKALREALAEVIGGRED